MSVDQVAAALTAMSTPRPIFPGDLVQITQREHDWFGAVAIVVGTPSWGLNLEQAQPRSAILEGRAQRDHVALVGVAALMPPDVAAARRDAIQTWQQVEAERAKS